MTTSWTEVWSFGQGASRTYCGIAETEGGYAVDIFHGFTCLEASEHPTYEDAHAAAVASRSRYRTVNAASRKARTFIGSGRLVPGSWLAQSADAPRRRTRARAL